MWEFYLDEFTLDIQPVDEMIFEAIIDLYESGKSEGNIIYTKDITQWIKENKKIDINKNKLGKTLKKLNFEHKKTRIYRGWIVTENIILSLKNFLRIKNKKLKNMPQVPHSPQDNINICNNNKNFVADNFFTCHTSATHLPHEKNNNINHLNKNVADVADMASSLKNKNVKLNNSQKIEDDNIFIDALEDLERKNKKSVGEANPEINVKHENQIDIFNTKPLDDIPDFKPLVNLKPYNDVTKIYFDIETTGLDPDKNQIIMIGVKDDKGNYTIFDGKERDIIIEFFAHIIKEQPYILTGHNVFKFDIPFINKRAGKYKIKSIFKLSKKDKFISGTSFNGSAIITDIYSCNIKNVNIIDSWILLARYDFGARKLKSYNLKNAIIQLGLRDERRLELTNDEIQSCYQTKDFETIIEYLKYDLDDTEMLINLLIPLYYYQLELFKDMNLQDLTLMGQASKWNMIISQFYDGYYPGADEKTKYEGGLVIANNGLYLNCAKLDIESLYPNIMLNYRIYTRKDKKQFSLSILKYLTQERLKFKKLAKSGDKEADYKQQAIKILINSLYGFLGTSGVRFNDMQSAALITAYGRAILRFMINEIEKAGGVVCEADTDGVIYSAKDNKKIFEIIKSKLPEGINIDFEFEAKAVLVLGKKNYIVLKDNDELIIKGKLTNRDRTKLEKEFYPNFLKNYLQSSEKAEEYYNILSNEIRNKKINKELLIYERVIRKGEKKLVEASIGKVGERVKYYIGEDNKPVKSGYYSINYYLNEINKMKKEIMDLINLQKV